MVISNVVQELMKDRLRIHLGQVEALIEVWAGQLSAPDAFSTGSKDVRTASYRPLAGEDSDNNHMLRKHVGSRALWRHHSAWIANLDDVFGLMDPVISLANSFVTKLNSASPELKYTELFAWTALEEAFMQLTDVSFARKYEPNSGRGFSFAGCVIEEIGTVDLLTEIENNHKALIEKLKRGSCWKSILAHWKEIRKIEVSMGKLVNDVLKSGDIFTPCRFCRKLFKA